MKKTKIAGRFTVQKTAIFLVALASSMTSGFACTDYQSVDCDTLSGGCTRGGWTVICAKDESSGCYVSTSICYEVGPTGDWCGDCCVYVQGCGTDCVLLDTIPIDVTGYYGTPSCDSNCDLAGQCINKTPYPNGTTLNYNDEGENPCSWE